MKKIVTFIMKPKVDHLVLGDICRVPEVQYIMESSLHGLKSSIENNGAPDVIFTDINSMPILSEISDLAHVEKKIILCSNEVRHKDIDYLEISNLYDFIDSLIDREVSSDENFEKIPLTFFYKMEKAIVDVFIRIQKQDGAKYILRYAKNDDVEIDELKDYESKGMLEFYVKASEKDELYNILSNSVCYEMESLDSLDSMKTALGFAQTLFQDNGYSPSSIQLIEELNTLLFNKLEKESKKSPQGELIKDILSSKDSLFYKKVSLQLILGMEILKKEEWAMERHYELYNFMTLFADIALTKSEMIYISTDDDYIQNSHDPMEAEILETHALLAFELLEKYQAKPINVDLLILEHHGVKSGVGFSKNLGANLNQIVIIFRVVENVAIEMLKNERDGTSYKMEEIYKRVEEKFESPRVAKILKNAFL